MATGEKPSESERAQSRVDKIRAARDTHRERNKIIRAAWVVAAAIIVLGGIAMIVLPGPAFIVIPIGLAMLSLEFAWAGRMLEHALKGTEGAKGVFKRQSLQVKVLIVAAIACGAAAAIAFGLWMVL